MAAPFDGRIPRVDVLEKNDAIFIRAELPSVSKDNIDISLTGDCATNTHQKHEKKVANYHCKEITRDFFSLTMNAHCRS